MLEAFFAALPVAVTVLVVDLHADNRAAVLIEESFDLCENFVVKFLRIAEIFFVVVAQIAIFREQPVRIPAVADLAVIPGTDAQQHSEPGLLAELDEVAQIPASRPIEAAFDFLVIDPEHVRRDDVDAARLHLRERALPIFSLETRIVDLAHDRQPRLAILQKIRTVHGDGMPGIILAFHQDRAVDRTLARQRDMFFHGVNLQWCFRSDFIFIIRKFRALHSTIPCPVVLISCALRQKERHRAVPLFDDAYIMNLHAKT